MDGGCMDKKSVILAIICILLALAWPSIMRKLYPPPPKSAATSVSTNQVAQATNAATTTIEAAPPAEKPAEVPKPKKEAGPRPSEQVVTVENDLLRLTFTSYGGGIKHAELKKYSTQIGKADMVDLNQKGKLPMGLVTGIEGFDTNTVFAIRQPDTKTIVLQAVNDDGVQVTKEFRVGSDYLVDGFYRLVNASSAPLKQARISIAMGTAAAVEPRDSFEIPYVSWGNESKSEIIDPSQFNSGWFGRKEREVVSRENVDRKSTR